MNTECTLHQLSPYIGKLKTTIASDLIRQFSRPGELVADPFAGSGTVPLEALIHGRRVFAADINPYATLLCKAKLSAPPTCDEALARASSLFDDMRYYPAPDLRCVPAWVRRFFHPRTLKEALALTSLCKRNDDTFLLACILGILHHQRPGFLSYPSSHLVPYLRDKKFPRTDFPSLYAYRDPRPRLVAKIRRVYSRVPTVYAKPAFSVSTSDIQTTALPRGVDCVLTSPPYMNALDYGRDNRLRLWFSDAEYLRRFEQDAIRSKEAFVVAISALAATVSSSLRSGGYCIMVVGERVARTYQAHPSQLVHEILSANAPALRLHSSFSDTIPDVRRSRRSCRGIKREHFLIYQRRHR